MKRVVIIGGGFGGLRAARALAKADAQVTVIDRNNHHVFQPLLYQVATAGLSPADIAAPIRSVLRKQRNTLVLMGDVVGVDTAAREVVMRDFSGVRRVPFDYLILATGANHSYFGKDEWEPFAPGLKTIQDATELRREILLAFEAAELEADPARLRELMTFVVVGGGPTGVEMAGAIAELGHKALAADFRRIKPDSARVLLVEAGPHVLGSFPEPLSKFAVKALQDLGVEVRVGARVEAVAEDHVVVAGERIPTRTVVWAAGVKASPAAEWIGAEADRAGRIKVNADLSVPGFEGIYAVGDTAAIYQADGSTLPGVAQVAMQSGEYVGRLIAKLLRGEAKPSGFKYKDKGIMATIGRNNAVAQIGRLKFTGFVAWFLWLFIHIWYLIDFQNRLLVLTQWAWAYVTFQRGARLIVQEDRPTPPAAYFADGAAAERGTSEAGKGVRTG